MKRWKKVALILSGVVAVAVIVLVSVHQVRKGVVTVQTGKVTRQDLTAVVTASGEIRPKTYTNVLGEGFGKITDIAVKEGDHVRRGDVLLRLENIQPAAEVEGQRAAISSGEATLKSTEATFQSGKAELVQAKADLEKAKFDWERAQNLFKDGLISKQEYDAQKASFESKTAMVDVKTALVQQRRAELEYAHWTLAQGRASLTRASDVLRKTTYTAPIDGVVTYIAVRVGENVVPGIQNAPGSYLMTISDMSVVTAEVKVDETDIVNVKLGQEADVTIDAIPGKTFKGRVSEVGTQAVLRTSGLATTQTTAGMQEAKDFKVVITLDQPPASLRPGLSTTGKINTAERKNVLAVPMQALAVRTRKDLEEAQKEASKHGSEGVTLAATKSASGSDPKREEIQGVFVVRAKKAVFVPVEPGITGVTEIEVTKGLNEGEEIVTGSYKALRTLRPGDSVKVDNKAPKKEEAEKS
jgi:HlyD family secretion protein